ncbi:unnamed protein product [Caenorhabditis sp. 36 PRJEB53466]|nr:unnamed protein product [Caenorhabditis sp. 36 PRJEB53466]
MLALILLISLFAPASGAADLYEHLNNATIRLLTTAPCENELDEKTFETCLIFVGNNTVSLKRYEYSFFHNQTDFMETISTMKFLANCIALCTCPRLRLYKYHLDGMIFVGEKIFMDAEDCFINGDVLFQSEKCTDYSRRKFSLKEYAAYVYDHRNKIMTCIDKDLQMTKECTDEKRKTIAAAFYAMIDVLVITVAPFSNYIVYKFQPYYNSNIDL